MFLVGLFPELETWIGLGTGGRCVLDRVEGEDSQERGFDRDLDRPTKVLGCAT